jgi:hypothetical protein
MSQSTEKAPKHAPEFQYVPVTPGGTACVWLASPTEAEAWSKLLVDAAHMPYRTKEGFVKRGYTVECWPAGVA